MKKTFTLFAALLLFTMSFAQKDVEIKLLSPANNSDLYENEAFDLTYSFKNVGTETIFPNDSFFLSLKIDGNYVMGAYDKTPQPHGTLSPGDSIFFTKLFIFAQTTPPFLFCFELTTSNNGVRVDNNLANNEACATVRVIQRGTTGINTAQPPPALTLYPNPAAENLFIKTTHPQAQQALITDHIGRQITSLNLQKSETLLSLEDLPDGIYFCRLISAQGYISIEKFVVNH